MYSKYNVNRLHHHITVSLNNGVHSLGLRISLHSPWLKLIQVVSAALIFQLQAQIASENPVKCVCMPSPQTSPMTAQHNEEWDICFSS